MNTRVNAFANLADPPAFSTKAKSEKPIRTETIERIAEDNNFVSRQAPKVAKEPRRKRRIYTTGRNQQFNIKVSNETLDRFYRMADDKRVPLCELLELALDALERVELPAG
jgi:hypothetical protein